jgi:hypothetical protein
MMMNTIMTHKFHKFWLKITAIIVGSFGPVFFFGTMNATKEPARLTLDILSWPLNDSSTFTSSDTKFLSALTGGFLLGWGIMIWLLSTWVYDKAQNEVRKTVLISLLAWFFLDSSGSIASGNASNVIFNGIILFMAVGPLWWAAKEKI